MMRVLIVGSGLVGTSLGLALSQADHEVWLADRSAEHVRVAEELGAGRPLPADAQPQVVVLAVPPSQFREVISSYSQQYVDATFTDVSSIKSQPLADVELTSGLSARFVGGHPLAGRETSGPAGAVVAWT